LRLPVITMGRCDQRETVANKYFQIYSLLQGDYSMSMRITLEYCSV
jgi:hypothetical protein